MRKTLLYPVFSLSIFFIFHQSFATEQHLFIDTEYRAPSQAQNSSQQKTPPPPVDISFLLADLKYNEKQGVKICEVQQGSMSLFRGFDFIFDEPGYIGELFCPVIQQYQNNLWFLDSDVGSKPLKHKLIEYGWLKLQEVSELDDDEDFMKGASISVLDPYDIHSYHGLLYAKPKSLGALDAFRAKYPGIMVMDAANTPYWYDKYIMSLLFSKNKILESVKPKWNLYLKRYSSSLANKIKKDLQCKVFVIKPRGACDGKGIIIVDEKNLDKTLKYILGDPNKLKHEQDIAYRYWLSDKYDSFLVEEYVPSDPINVSLLNNRPYNGTMRVVFILVYHQEEIRMHFLGGYWILPKNSLSESGTLNDRNKACVQFPKYCAVEPSVFETVKEQLREPLLLMYKRMLNISE